MKSIIFGLITLMFFSAGLWSKPDQVQVSADQAALRELPSQQSRVILTVRRATRLQVVEKLAEWYEVFTPDGKSKAFVHANLVQPVAASRTPTATEAPAPVEKPEKPVLGKLLVNVARANIRELPDPQSRILAGAEQGRELSYTGRSGNWYEVILPDGRGTGFISAGIVEELTTTQPPAQSSEPAKKARAERPEKTEVKPAVKPGDAEKKSKPRRAPRNKVKKTTGSPKKIYLAGFYYLGMQQEEARANYTTNIYFEEASFSTLYEIADSSSFSAALGYHFSPALALEIGAEISSRDLNALNSFSIPHPLWAGSSRSGESAFTGKLEEIGAFLNLVYVLRFNPLQLRLAAGPCYLMAKAGIISDFSLAESAYPFETINVSAEKVDSSQNVFGFNVAASMGFSFSESFSLLIQARYINARAMFNTGTDYPGLEINLGGFKLGAGLQISF